MTTSEQTLSFRGGAAASTAPLAVVVSGAAVLVGYGAPTVEGMIVLAIVGISLGLVLARDMGTYTELVFTLMANRTVAVAVVCWLWAGAFSGILADSGLVEAIVWMGWKLDLTGAGFVVAVFASSALFAVSVGTGLGTILGFTAVMYPAGVVLGGDPAALMGAIFSGAAFGDNLAPISDTTIVSATTQETDVGGVVASRLKYVLPAAGISAILFGVFGGGAGAIQADEANQLMKATADPKGLPMLIPAVVVFVVAIWGRNFLAALTAGLASAVVIGPIAGVFTLDRVVHVTAEGTVEGSMVSGAMGLVPTGILAMLLVTAINLMHAGGFLQKMMDGLDRSVARTVRGAEAAIVALISFANVCVSVNTVAMITVGPLANDLRKRHGIGANRSANLLDTISCSFPYMLPYAAVVSAAGAIQTEVAERHAFAPIVPWQEEAPYMFYCIVLTVVMLFSVVTGYGRSKG
jgi:Na+/H+ antiporter NhaC